MNTLLELPRPIYTPRPYQEEAINRALSAISKGSRAPLVVMPTGTGKMVVAAEILRRTVAKGNTGLFAVHRREMVGQCSEKLTAMAVRHGLILPGHDPGNLERAYAGTVQSMTARLRRGSFDPFNVRVVVIDEAHHATTKSYDNLREAFPNAVVIGLTATPTRKDGTGLGNVFDTLVQGITYSEALAQGYLVRPTYYAPFTPDLSEVQTRAGDYAEEQLEGVMNQPRLTGDIVSHYAKYAADRQGIVFATRVRHSIALAAEFTRAGFSAFHIDGKTDDVERDELMQAYREGEYQIMVNVGIGTEGLDVPNVGAVVDARPTQSLGLYMQMVGRALRPAEGKTDCLVLSHSGNALRFGPVEQYEQWELHAKKGGKGKKKEQRDPKETTCEECGAIFTGRRCPACGHMHVTERQPLDLEVEDGELVKVGEKPVAIGLDEKRAWYQMLLGFAHNNNMKPGWAYHAYHAKFKVYPVWGKQEPRTLPTAEVMGWANAYLKSQRIAWAKRKEKERRQVEHEAANFAHAVNL